MDGFINPLSIPVAQTTPEEHELQARMHALDVAYHTLSEFWNEANEPVRILMLNGPQYSQSSSLRLVHSDVTLNVRYVILTTSGDYSLVIFFTPATSSGGYGAIYDGRLEALNLSVINGVFSDHTIQDMARSLSRHRESIDLLLASI